MTIALTNETKTTEVTLTLETRVRNNRWIDRTETWAQAKGTWAVPGNVLIEEDKTASVSLSLENKT